VCSSGSVRSALTRCERAGGISESRRDVKMSARFATCQVSQYRLRCERDAVGEHVYLQSLLRLEHFGERFAGLDAQSVSEELDLLDLVVALEVLDVWLNVLGGGELEALALERKDLGSRHCAQKTCVKEE
jgi:hypothetical protein